MFIWDANNLIFLTKYLAKVTKVIIAIFCEMCVPNTAFFFGLLLCFSVLSFKPQLSKLTNASILKRKQNKIHQNTQCHRHVCTLKLSPIYTKNTNTHHKHTRLNKSICVMLVKFVTSKLLLRLWCWQLRAAFLWS